MSSNTTVASIIPSDRIYLISQHYATSFTQFVEALPGGAILVRYIQYSYQDDPIRSAVELALLLFAVRYFFSKKTTPNSKIVPLSNKEIDDLCKGWKPEPLVREVPQEELYKLKRIPIIDGAIGSNINLKANTYLQDDYTLEDRDTTSIVTKDLEKVLNLGSNDFLNLSHDKQIKDVAAQIIKNHGVGACGPPGFFGNQDIHAELEKKLAKWFGTEAAIIYGQDYATAVSIIPAFLKRGDVALVDSGVNLAIQKGVMLSRCQIIYYRHNDLDHLTAILEDLQDELKDIKPLNRRFIISEGLFANYGDYPDVAKLVDIKKKYKFRLFLDETLSVGVFGKNGKGLTDFYNVPAKEIDILVGSLANSMASSGGFCVGAKPMVFNQRIASAAYCYSASLPPYCARVAQEFINIVEKETASKKDNLLTKLNDNTTCFYEKMQKNRKVTKYAKVISTELSPVVLIELNQSVKKALGFKKYYINENDKNALVNEKTLQYYEGNDDKEYAAADAKNSQKQSFVAQAGGKIKEEVRADYYSEAYIKKKKAEEKALLAKQHTKHSDFELLNLEEFLLTKIANDLLIKDKIYIVSSQRLLPQEILRVAPTFRISVKNTLTTSEIDRVVDKLGYHLQNVLDSVKSIDDVKRLAEA